MVTRCKLFKLNKCNSEEYNDFLSSKNIRKDAKFFLFFCDDDNSYITISNNRSGHDCNGICLNGYGYFTEDLISSKSYDYIKDIYIDLLCKEDVDEALLNGDIEIKNIEVLR